MCTLDNDIIYMYISFVIDMKNVITYAHGNTHEILLKVIIN